MKKSVLLSACLLLFLSGCSKKSETEATKLSEDQKQAILNYANSITDNLLTGFNEANYTKYSRDFDEKMKNSLTLVPRNELCQKQHPHTRRM